MMRRCPKSLSSSTWACGLTPNYDGITTSGSVVAFASTGSGPSAGYVLCIGGCTLGGVHPCAGHNLPKVVLRCQCLGRSGSVLARLLPIDRVLRQAAVLTLGLLCMTSGPKTLAICGWLPADMEIRYAIVRFILHQEAFGRGDLLDIDYVLGVNQRISALDIAHQEVTAFRASSAAASRRWDHLDTLQFWVRPPSLG